MGNAVGIKNTENGMDINMENGTKKERKKVKSTVMVKEVNMAEGIGMEEVIEDQPMFDGVSMDHADITEVRSMFVIMAMEAMEDMVDTEEVELWQNSQTLILMSNNK